MAFYSLDVYRSSEFAMEFLNNREVIDVVRLFCWSGILLYCEDHPVNGDFAVHQPSEFTSKSESPVPCYHCDEEKGCGEATQFAACGAAYVYWAINWTSALEERAVFVGCFFPAKGACCGE